MSCWVVPNVAAELWGVPVEAIQSRIRDGSLSTRDENGFTFIDVAPDSPVLETPRAFRPTPPPTYRIVSREEILALVGDLPADEHEAEDEQGDAQDWRLGRSEAGRIRRPPESLAA